MDGEDVDNLWLLDRFIAPQYYQERENERKVEGMKNISPGKRKGISENNEGKSRDVGD